MSVKPFVSKKYLEHLNTEHIEAEYIEIMSGLG